MSVVVSDTSPIRALAHLGLVDVLHELYGTVVVPPAVHDELRNPSPQFSPIDVSLWPFIQLRSPSNQAAVVRLARFLDAGEAEAIILAGEIQADAVLIDESDGRSEARSRGLIVVGTLGVMIQAKQAGLIGLIHPLIDRLQNELRFFLAPALISKVLEQVGEMPAQP